MGVQTEVLRQGDGVNFPSRGQTLVVHWTGYLQSGQKFDSSLDRREPFSFRLGMNQVIRGWDEGLAELSLGQKVRMTISPDFAYGAHGYPGVVPPNATLIFEVELISFR